MLEVFGAWTARLILLLVAAGVIHLALPGGSLRRYVELVVGFTVLAVVLAPLLGWLGSDFEWVFDQVAATIAISDRDADMAAAVAAGAAWRAQSINKATAAQLESWLHRQLQRQFGVDARVQVHAAGGGSDEAAYALQVEVELGREEPPAGPPSQPVVTELIAVGQVGPITVARTAAPELSPVPGGVVDLLPEGGTAGDDLATRVRAWVVSALDIDERAVEVRSEEVLP